MNLMAKGVISLLSFEDISELCRHISRRVSKYGKESRHSNNARVTILASGGVSRVELGNFLERFRKIFWVLLVRNLIH